MTKYSEYFTIRLDNANAKLNEEIEASIKRIRAEIDRIEDLKQRSSSLAFVASNLTDSIDSIKSWNKGVENALREVLEASMCLDVCEYYEGDLK